MTRILHSPWTLALVGGLLYLATTAVLLRPERLGTLPTIVATGFSPNADPSWRFRNPEFEQWVQELKQERESLAVREEQLRDLQSRLEAERQEILSVTQTVHQMQVDFDKTLVRFKEQELDNLKHQTKVISGMSPEGAAIMLREMTDDQMVRILFALKPDGAGPILDAFSKLGKEEAKRAAEAANRLRQVMLPPAKSSRSVSAG